ncbi:hypothetical protein A7U60_g3684 [Sanghuangporus baumii]|uniref:Uncharacterized protein n=1 Tax=Sanghuangporus baumii TaxID=108892 RepID=A0A9Q5I038_SANBA|nr:hypothetical protein A7U60_g3684 [Sanghuangporus baumii]
MKLALATLPLLSLYSPIVNANTYGLGKSWLIGQGSTSSIQKVTTTLNPGFPPSNQTGSLKLYPASSNGTGDLLMTSVESWSDQSWCGGTVDQCNQKATFGQFAPLNANESLTIVFERSSDGSNWTQSAIVNDQVVSQVGQHVVCLLRHLSFPSGPMTLFGMTTECNDNCAMTISPQTYSDTTIELSAPDLSWNSTAVDGSQVYGGEGVTNISEQAPTVVTGLSSQDGQVWTVEEIMIPALD